MRKEDYYKISKEQKIPLRCPCLSTCARYRFTAFAIGKMHVIPRHADIEKAMQELGILNDGEEVSKMLYAGEPVTTIGGKKAFSVYNACPEFFLHPHEHKPVDIQDAAIEEGSYDLEYKGDRFRAGKSKHYTECAEYSFFTSKRSLLKNRKRISAKVRAELQKEINSKCPFCSNEEVGHFQVHHIDETPDNNRFENLLMLCPNCHSKITKGDIIQSKVEEVKNNLDKY